MIGALLGDLAASDKFESDQLALSSRTHLTFFGEMTHTVMQAVLDNDRMHKGLGQRYKRLRKKQDHYVSQVGLSPFAGPCGFAAESADHAASLARNLTGRKADPDGLGEALARAVYLARHGSTMSEIDRQLDRWGPWTPSLSDLFTHVKPVPSTVVRIALAAVRESDSFEDALISVLRMPLMPQPYHSLAAATGALAEAYFGVPRHLRRIAMIYLSDDDLALYRYWNGSSVSCRNGADLER